MTEGAARRGTRDNGLRCAAYTVVADLDPRVADALLETLRDAGIAAYAGPAPGVTGGYMETRLPSRPVDRLWVDEQLVEQARRIIDTEQPTQPSAAMADVDVDAAWQQVLASLQTPSSAPVPPWPVSEDIDDPSATDEGRMVRAASTGDGDDGDVEDEHFVPPPPPPLPRFHRKTLAALAAIALGLVILATNFDGGTFTVLAVLAILGGLASLVWRMHDGPPTDSGWDDGAVV
jgi:hypothetical protein